MSVSYFLLFLFSFYFSSCAVVEKKTELNSLSSTSVKIYEINSKIKLECSGQHNCEQWSHWLKETLEKSSKQKISKQFYRHASEKHFRAKKFSDLVNNFSELVISYGEYHCLDNQMSCVFDGENKIFFNKNSFQLNKIDWLRIFWHEIFHLNYPDVVHVNCSSCPERNAQVYSECDKNSFSSYGLEQYWLKTHAHHYFSDKTFNRQHKKVLQDLSNRICR